MAQALRISSSHSQFTKASQTMDRTNTQKRRPSPAPRVDRQPSLTVNETTDQNTDSIPRSAPAPRAIHNQLPRLQTNPPTTFQQAVEVGKFPNPPTTTNRKETNPPTTIQHAGTQAAQHKLATLAGP
jgi:hypothetical protein